MKERQHLWATLVFGLTVLALVILSAGIGRLEMQKGIFFSAQRDSQVSDGSNFDLLAVLEPISSRRSLFISIVALTLLVLLLVYFLVSADARKNILRMLVRMILWGLALLIILPRLALSLKLAQQSLAGSGGVPAEDVMPHAPSWLSFATSLLLIPLIVGLVWFFYWKRRTPKSPLKDVTLPAISALQEMQAGGDFRNIILRCYFEMCQALNRQRGIQRREWMTPREFEQRLVELGLPAAPVKQLTRLFEKARYGPGEPDIQEEHQATACLTAILEAAGIAA